jgi:hypothetical protein
MAKNSESSWTENSQFILRELERLNDNIETMLTEVHQLKTEVALIKYKHSIMGAIGGALAWVAFTFFEKSVK